VPVKDEDAVDTARHRAKQLGPGKNIVTVICLLKAQTY
jgi:hypothetical protein